MYIYMWVLRWLSAKESTCHGQKSLVGYSPWGHKESDMIEHASMHIYIYIYVLVGKVLVQTVLYMSNF